MEWIEDEDDYEDIQYTNGKRVERVFPVKDPSCKDETRANYTLSPVSTRPGWNTDSGYDGYGIPKKLAEIYAKAINEYIERHGPIDMADVIPE